MLYMAFTNHTFNIHPHLVPAHTHTHTAGTHARHTHTYNILPCFESICGSAQSPLHKLFVTTERARGLLLWWLSEKTQKTARTSLSSYTVYGLNLTPKNTDASSISAHKEHIRTYTASVDGSDS